MMSTFFPEHSMTRARTSRTCSSSICWRRNRCESIRYILELTVIPSVLYCCLHIPIFSVGFVKTIVVLHYQDIFSSRRKSPEVFFFLIIINNNFFSFIQEAILCVVQKQNPHSLSPNSTGILKENTDYCMT